MPTPEEAFGLVLRKLRTEKGFSQERLALEGNLDRTFISLLERGKRQPSLTTIIHISSVLGISASNLIAEIEKIMSLDKENHDNN
jgi:transcriptional regulator with XRE-family HTH domain